MTIFNTNPLGVTCRLLLVEDDPDDVLLFRHAVPEGCELEVVANGDDALRAIARKKPDLIFLDLILPGMAGEDVCKSIRLDADPEVARIPIVMVTGKSLEADSVIGRVIGANSYITKPYAVDSIQEVIHRHLPGEKWPGRKTNKILVIEDDPEDWELIKTMLSHDKRQSYNLVHMDRLQKGLEYLAEVQPELTIMDLNLPDSHGIETFQKVIRSCPRTPVIVLSATADEVLAEQTVHLGAQDFIMKMNLNSQILSRSVRYGIERQALIETSQKQALVDDLTGLHNRRAFMLLVEQQLRALSRQKRFMLMVYADMDNLKVINDRWGHATGDQALRELAALLKSLFRRSDIVARLGGDEFAVVEVDCNSANVEQLQDRLAEGIRKWNQARSHLPYRIEVSFGIECFDLTERKELAELLEQADASMYAQKTLRKKKLQTP